MFWINALYAFLAYALFADVISALNKYLVTRQPFHFHYHKFITYRADFAPAAPRSRDRHNSI